MKFQSPQWLLRFCQTDRHPCRSATVIDVGTKQKNRPDFSGRSFSYLFADLHDFTSVAIDDGGS
ncbi:MAG: hypothetical protein SOY62_03365, partial [Streptococcus orisratti]|nr:hypothetical protein [Streptococcus orisratti]